MMLPEDRKLIRIQKQFQMEGEGSHEPVKQCRDIELNMLDRVTERRDTTA